MFCDNTRLLRSIASEEDVEVQSDLNKIYHWAEQNNMEFNDKKFEVLRYGTNNNIKENTFYLSSNQEIIEEKEHLRDLGLEMSNSASFADHIDKVCSKVKQKTGWVLRTFNSRSPFFMKTIWRQLVQPHIDYCSQVYQPVTGGELLRLEELQKYFISRINVPNDNYWERLHLMKMTSIQRRFERYRLIYVWKNLRGVVPNCNVSFSQHPRFGRHANFQLKRNKIYSD